MEITAATTMGDTTMVEPEVYLEKLSAFSRMLRLEGLAVSPKETEDASRLLIALGLEDRNRVKTALRTVYAKSREEQIPLTGCLMASSFRKKKCASRPKNRWNGRKSCSSTARRRRKSCS